MVGTRVQDNRILDLFKIVQFCSKCCKVRLYGVLLRSIFIKKKKKNGDKMGLLEFEHPNYLYLKKEISSLSAGILEGGLRTYVD